VKADLGVSIIELSDSYQWDEVVEATDGHDAFHHAAYHDAMANASQVLLVVVTRGSAIWALPLELRPLGALDDGRGCYDATSAYGYSGPTWTDDWRAEDHLAAWNAVASELTGRGVVTTFLRLHPLRPDPPVLPPASVLKDQGGVVLMDLGDDAEAYWSALRKKQKNELRRAARDGLSARSLGLDGLQTFHRLYDETMLRLSSRSEYRFASDRLERLLTARHFKARIVEVSGASAVLASGIFISHGSTAHYFLSGSASHHAHGSRPTRLMIHHAREVLACDGCRTLNLGGGRGASDDSLFAFKAGFSASRARFRSVRWVLDLKRYRSICRRAGVVPSPLAEGWFPAYRRPAPSPGNH
jgi:hypothetical protein